MTPEDLERLSNLSTRQLSLISVEVLREHRRQLGVFINTQHYEKARELNRRIREILASKEKW